MLSKWTKRVLTYRLDGASDAPAVSLLGELYEEAARLWTEYIPMDIRPARPGETIDIEVQFCAENDLQPLCDALTDNSGRRFAGEATLPSRDASVRQSIALPGDLNSPIDRNVLVAVLVHELGHSLGLLHSNEPEAVMYPVITADNLAAGVHLHADDVGRIQDLYGGRGGTNPPADPVLSEVPTDPDCVPPDPNGPDRDGDGLSDVFEEVELIEGTPARAPVVCPAPDDGADGTRVLLLDAAYFDETGFQDGEFIRITNLRTGCSADDVAIRRSDDPDCTARMPREIREELCIYQLNVAVRLRVCKATSPVVLEDFEHDVVISTEGRTTTFGRIPRAGSVVLEVNWALQTYTEFSFLVVGVAESQFVGPGQSLVANIEVDRPQIIEVGTKSGPSGGPQREDFLAFPLRPNPWKPEVSVPIADIYELTEVDFVLEGKYNCDPGGAGCDPWSGTFWVDRLRLERTPEVLYDFERGFDPPPVEGADTDVVERPVESDNQVLQFSWSFGAAPAGRDPYVVLVFSGIAVGPCDRLFADLEVSEPTTVRLEAKTPDPIVKDTRSRVMQPGLVEEIEILISTRYALGEIAVVVERDLNVLSSGTVWLDNIRLVRGE